MILKSVLARSDDRAHRCAGLVTQRISADLKYVRQRPIVDTVRRNRAGSGGGNCARKPVSSAFPMPDLSRFQARLRQNGNSCQVPWFVDRGSCLAGRLNLATSDRTQTTDYEPRTTNYGPRLLLRRRRTHGHRESRRRNHATPLDLCPDPVTTRFGKHGLERQVRPTLRGGLLRQLLDRMRVNEVLCVFAHDERVAPCPQVGLDITHGLARSRICQVVGKFLVAPGDQTAARQRELHRHVAGGLPEHVIRTRRAIDDERSPVNP